MKPFAFTLLPLMMTMAQGAPDPDEVARLIAASQTGVSTQFFNGADEKVPLLVPSTFNHPEECLPRQGLPNFFRKVKAGGAVTVAYLGGSITRAEGYRPLSARWLAGRYPKAKIQGINAGVSGTPTDLGALRVGDQVIRYRPDLVFVEFAVNGGTVEALEGIVRQIWKADPATDICFIYTIIDSQWKPLAEGRVSGSAVKYDALAAHYGIPGIHLAREAAAACLDGKLLFKGKATAEGLPIFSTDGVHPTDRGGAVFYMNAMARSLVAMENQGTVGGHPIPPPMTEDPWEDARMVDPAALTGSPGWKKIVPDAGDLKGYRAWFPHLLVADQAGESLRFKFRGKGFGFFDIGAPEVGQLKVTVDGKALAPVNRFGVHCNNRTRGQYHFIPTEPGDHEVVLTIDETIPDKFAILGPSQQQDIKANPEKYNRRVIYLGKVLVRGEIK